MKKTLIAAAALALLAGPALAQSAGSGTGVKPLPGQDGTGSADATGTSDTMSTTPGATNGSSSMSTDSSAMGTMGTDSTSTSSTTAGEMSPDGQSNTANGTVLQRPQSGATSNSEGPSSTTNQKEQTPSAGVVPGQDAN
ncbi:hypothetical protein [Mangrovicella endophytica]|uniref:hypothetical protein n=1 Tax=Mangrovicella endophytica TaxID=2066697 RepID=UPI000C9E1919|nr:hypothetical protein [Mangrovicella endophytica]